MSDANQEQSRLGTQCGVDRDIRSRIHDERGDCLKKGSVIIYEENFWHLKPIACQVVVRKKTT
jgi:hypothetical protein